MNFDYTEHQITFKTYTKKESGALHSVYGLPIALFPTIKSSEQYADIIAKSNNPSDLLYNQTPFSATIYMESVKHCIRKESSTTLSAFIKYWERKVDNTTNKQLFFPKMPWPEVVEDKNRYYNVEFRIDTLYDIGQNASTVKKLLVPHACKCDFDIHNLQDTFEEIQMGEESSILLESALYPKTPNLAVPKITHKRCTYIDILSGFNRFTFPQVLNAKSVILHNLEEANNLVINSTTCTLFTVDLKETDRVTINSQELAFYSKTTNAEKLTYNGPKINVTNSVKDGILKIGKWTDAISIYTNQHSIANKTYVFIDEVDLRLDVLTLDNMHSQQNRLYVYINKMKSGKDNTKVEIRRARNTKIIIGGCRVTSQFIDLKLCNHGLPFNKMGELMLEEVFSK